MCWSYIKLQSWSLLNLTIVPLGVGIISVGGWGDMFCIYVFITSLEVLGKFPSRIYNSDILSLAVTVSYVCFVFTCQASGRKLDGVRDNNLGCFFLAVTIYFPFGYDVSLHMLRFMTYLTHCIYRIDLRILIINCI